MKTKILLFTLALIAFLTGCENQKAGGDQITTTSPTTRKVIPIADFPATSPVELTYQKNVDDELNCPVAARYAAIYELLEGGYQLLEDLRSENVYGISGVEEYLYHDEYNDVAWSLTDNPRAIYNYDGTIKYYEFGLIENNVVTSTITVNARPEAPYAIAYIFPYVLPYTYTNQSYYIGNYPHRVFFDGTGYRYIEENDNDRQYLETDMDVYWNEVYSNATLTEIDELDLLRGQAECPDVEFEEAAEAYWDSVSSAIKKANEVLSIESPCVMDSRPPKPIENTYIDHLADVLRAEGVSFDYCRDYTARAYCDTHLQQTFWSGACGPAALAWVYRGLISEYPRDNGTYLPLHGDVPPSTYFKDAVSFSYYRYLLESLDTLNYVYGYTVRERYCERSDTVDGGLTKYFYGRCLPFKVSGEWNFMMLPSSLNNALKEVTNDRFGVGVDCTAQTAANWIHTANLPIILLVREITHYLVAYGYGGISEVAGGDIDRFNLYFLVTDNGSRTGANHYKPFWRRYREREYYHRVKRLNL